MRAADGSPATRVARSAVQPERAVDGFAIRPLIDEVVEGGLAHADEVPLNERRSLFRTVFAVLDGAFPFEHRPAVVVVHRELGEDRAEIDVAIARRAEAASTIRPVGEA